MKEAPPFTAFTLLSFKISPLGKGCLPKHSFSLSSLCAASTTACHASGRERGLEMSKTTAIKAGPSSKQTMVNLLSAKKIFTVGNGAMTNKP